MKIPLGWESVTYLSDVQQTQYTTEENGKLNPESLKDSISDVQGKIKRSIK